MAKENKNNESLRINQFIEFFNPKTKEYFEWLDQIKTAKFNAIFPFEWNKMLLLFGKGEEDFKPQLSLEEMEEIYGGD